MRRFSREDTRSHFHPQPYGFPLFLLIGLRSERSALASGRHKVKRSKEYSSIHFGFRLQFIQFVFLRIMGQHETEHRFLLVYEPEQTVTVARATVVIQEISIGPLDRNGLGTSISVGAWNATYIPAGRSRKTRLLSRMVSSIITECTPSNWT